MFCDLRLFYYCGKKNEKGREQMDILIQDAVNLCNELCEKYKNLSKKEKIKCLLCENGAQLVGVGDMHDVENCEYPIGISIAIPLPKHLICDLQSAPTKEYREVYFNMNKKLNHIVMLGEQFLKDAGYESYAQTTERVIVNEQHRSKIPHKTVAIRAGLGWIGKNNLLVTQKFGSAVRISSLLTNASLECDKIKVRTN